MMFYFVLYEMMLLYDSNQNLLPSFSFIGIFVSPALVSYFQVPLLDASPEDESTNTAGGSVDFVTVLKQLGLTVLLPLVIGQGIQMLFTEPVAKFKVKCRLSDVSSFCLLLMVWSVFSDAVHAGSFSAVAGKDIAVVIILNFLLYTLFSILSFLLARLPYSKRIFGPLKWFDRLQYSREDTVAVMVCVLCITNIT
jgi:sodium/bile acid cotransporter 7